MRAWNWLWTLSGAVGVVLVLFKLHLIRFMQRVTTAKGINGDTQALLAKNRRDNRFRLFALGIITAIGVGSFTKPPPPPLAYWDWYLWLYVVGLEAVAVSLSLAVALDIRDRLRLIYGSVGNWARSRKQKSAGGGS